MAPQRRQIATQSPSVLRRSSWIQLRFGRGIAEIFAEDYAQLALSDSKFVITWLEPADETVLAAMRADLGLGPPPVTVKPPAVKPVSIRRNGSLAPHHHTAIPFNLLGPSRRVTATATFSGAAEKHARATLEVRCDRKRVALKTLRPGRTAFAIDQRDLGVFRHPGREDGVAGGGIEPGRYGVSQRYTWR